MKIINDLNKVVSKRLLSKHDVLFREGDTLGEGYIINYGLISLEKNNKKVETLGEGEVLGVFNVFFDNKTHNIIGWQTKDIYQNINVTYLSSIQINRQIDKNLFKLPIQN